MEAEQAVLGGLLQNNRAFDRVGDILEAHHFADAAHARIYAAIADRIRAGKAADAITLKGLFEAEQGLEDVGGARYLATLLSATVGAVNIREYAGIVVDMALRRETIEACELAAAAAYDPHGPTAREILDGLDTSVVQLGAQQAGAENQLTNSQVYDQFMSHIAAVMRLEPGEVVGLSTGIRSLDRRLGGLRPTRVYVIAAPSSAGKSALGATMARNLGLAGKRVYFANLEMDAIETYQRMVAQESGLPAELIIDGYIEFQDGSRRSLKSSRKDQIAVEDAARRLRAMGIHWDQQAGSSIAAIRSRARQFQRAGGLDAIFIDYLQLAEPPSIGGKKAASRTEAIGEITRAIKRLAKDLKVPVVALSQVNRGVDSREEKRLQMSDLRESGTIEQDADVIMFLYREHYYLLRNEPLRKLNEDDAAFQLRHSEWRIRRDDAKGKALISCPKSRQGKTFEQTVGFEDTTTAFFDLPEDDG
ncbi:replicative DNA helicase [Rhodovarius crocodyli]|nr:DnaB-like helicase C-terminal domain-containing protein [Rhodovarius crocodyli]